MAFNNARQFWAQRDLIGVRLERPTAGRRAHGSHGDEASEVEPTPDRRSNVNAADTSDHASLTAPGYYPSLSGRDATFKLSASGVGDGTYLLRDSNSTPGALALSVRNGDKVTHYLIERSGNEFIIGGKNEFPSLERLIQHFSHSRRPPVPQLRSPFVEEDPEPVYDRQLLFDAWVVDESAVTVEEGAIGKGAAGEVFKGVWNGLDVAVKRVGALESMDASELLREAEFMKKLHHENIVQLYGICPNPGLIVMEYMANGSLLDYLKAHYDRLTFRDLMGLAEQVASGMAHLESKKLIHRDLAGRNVLVDANGVAKVADFGMSRLLHAPQGVYNASGLHKFPVRWAAPEAFRGEYSAKSDVWSFGVLLVELVTLGAIPYRGMKNEEVAKRVPAGYRMPCPARCPAALYVLMTECWRDAPAERPSFAALRARLPALGDAVGADGSYLDCPTPCTPTSSGDSSDPYVDTWQ